MKIATLILACMAFVTLHAQVGTVENSLWSVQAGIFGVWINNESRLDDAFAIRSEIAFTGGYSYTSYSGFDSDFEGESYAIVPLITAEPRWYYNIGRRAAKGKNTARNAADFLAIRTTIAPGLMLVSKNAAVYKSLSVIPVWGIRRNLSCHFNFELSGGLGYIYTKQNNNRLGWDFSVRFGYTF
ncbi:MAG: hypothetical protein LBR67_11075 [Dysgonamonadaceae bacterium]|jgi:hypothetical protein|nr:hypothetical protein [Dysgonamonadaceae bacterium]